MIVHMLLIQCWDSFDTDICWSSRIANKSGAPWFCPLRFDSTFRLFFCLWGNCDFECASWALRSVTFLTFLYQKCLGDHLSLPIWHCYMNNKHYCSPVSSDSFVGSDVLSGGGSLAVCSFINSSFLVFLFPQEKKNIEGLFSSPYVLCIMV